MGVIQLISSIFGGGVTGLLGAVVTKITEYKTAKLKADHEIEMRKADAAIMAQEWAARTQMAQVEASAKVDAADAQSFADSYRLEPQMYSDPKKATSAQEWLFVFLDFMRGIVRPALTIYLCALTTAIYLQAHALLGTGMDKTQAVVLVSHIIDTVLYLTVTVVCWWFGVRTKTK